MAVGRRSINLLKGIAQRALAHARGAADMIDVQRFVGRFAGHFFDQFDDLAIMLPILPCPGRFWLGGLLRRGTR
jgi:hypothetical protein